MATTTGQRLAPRAVLVVIALLFCVAAMLLATSGSRALFLVLGALVVVPCALYAALLRPLSMVFGLYVLLVPFDNLLGAGSFGTLTKLLGGVAGVALLLWTVRNAAYRPADHGTRSRATRADDERAAAPPMNGACHNPACRQAAPAEPVELYPGPGEYCPECGERLAPLRRLTPPPNDAPIARTGVVSAPSNASAMSLMFLLTIAVWMLVSALWALDQRTAMQSMPTYAALFLLYAVLTIVPISAAEFRLLLFLVVAGGLAAAAYGVNTFYHHQLIAENGTTARLVLQVGSTRIDPNHFGNALLFPAAVITMWTLRTSHIAAKLAGLGGLTLLTVAVLFSGSRESLVGMLLIFGYYVLRSRHRVQLAIAAAVIVPVATAVQTSMWTRLSTVFATGGTGRTSIWMVAFEAAKHRLLHGYGIGNFQQAYDLYYIGVHQTYPFGFSSPAHSLVLHYLVELGVAGLAVIACFFWVTFRSLRHVSVGSELYDYRLMLEGSLIAIAFVSLTIDLFTYKYAWLVFSMIALLRTRSMRPS